MFHIARTLLLRPIVAAGAGAAEPLQRNRY